MSPIRPVYDPPYDSPLEDAFARNFTKYAGDMDVYEPQKRINTICGPFILDFAAGADGQVVGIECDGKACHDSSRDEWRDAMLLGSGEVDTIYRLRGGDLYYRMDDCLFVMSRIDPGLFSERGIVNLERLASDSARAYNFSQGTSVVLLSYPREDQTDPQHIFLERRTRHIPPGRREFWVRLYDFATERGGGDLDALIAEFRAQTRPA